jgi:hypothetical protein
MDGSEPNLGGFDFDAEDDDDDDDDHHARWEWDAGPTAVIRAGGHHHHHHHHRRGLPDMFEMMAAEPFRGKY